MSEPVYSLRDVWFRYKFSRNWVFRGLTLEIEEGFWVIAGPNGGGKTTLIKLLLGVLKPNSGEIYLRNKKISSPADVREYAIYLPTNVRSYLVGPRVIDEFERIEEGEKLIDLIERHGVNLDLEKPIYHLSEGQMRLVANLTALYSNKEIVFLDEPTIGLDKKFRRLFLESLEGIEGKTLIISSNDIRLLQEARNMLYIEGSGRVIKGDSRDIFYRIEDLRSFSPIVQFANTMGLADKKPVSIKQMLEVLEGEYPCQASS